jgi:tetratricopeptide (TPR) repeat protein
MKIALPVSILLFFTLFISPLQAAGKFEFSPLARQAYNKTMALKLDEAESLINQLRKNEPDNLIVHLIENHKECLVTFVNEQKADYSRYLPNAKKRLEILKFGDSNSPYYLFAQAQVRLMWAMNRAKFGDLIDAFTETSAAYDYLEKNQKKFPDFLPNKMVLGVLHAVVGTIPDNYKWGFKFFSGMNGTVEQGQAEIEEVIRYAKTNDFIFEQEALVMYSFLMLHLNNQNESAWSIINSGKLKPKENVLACFALANVATRTGRNDLAIETLQNRPTASGFYTVPYLDYMLGLAKMYRGDGDADVYLKNFIVHFNGRNYLKEAYQRIAWLELLKGDYNSYKAWIENCKTKGRADIGNDKNAMKEAKNGIAPEPNLLRGRLYFDGGYLQKAVDFLKNKKESDFTNVEHKLEYTYRMGRILQAQKKPNEAIQYFDKTIQQGKNTKYYFACNAALQLAIIYEEYKQYDKAREFYTFCLQLDPDDYADSMHAKAKAGLSRLKGK